MAKSIEYSNKNLNLQDFEKPVFSAINTIEERPINASSGEKVGNQDIEEFEAVTINNKLNELNDDFEFAVSFVIDNPDIDRKLIEDKLHSMGLNPTMIFNEADRRIAVMEEEKKYNHYNVGRGYTGDEPWFKDAVVQLAKLIYHEVGADPARDPSLNYFLMLSVASVCLNLTTYNNKTYGDNPYELIHNYGNGTYEGYSNYKDSPITKEIPTRKEMEEAIFAAEQVLLGNYNFPSTMLLQADYGIVSGNGKVWGEVLTKKGFFDVYFGYIGGLNNTDFFGNEIPDNSFQYYVDLAHELEKRFNNIPSDFSYIEYYGIEGV